MLRADSRLCPVDSKRHEAEKCVEIESAQAADVATHAEIALQKNRLGEERDQERHGEHEQHDGVALGTSQTMAAVVSTISKLARRICPASTGSVRRRWML